jgi:NUMOD3 motif
MKPEYNILKMAGSLLGFNHTAKIKAKLREAMTGENNPNFGKSLSTQTKAKLCDAHVGKSISAQTKAKQSEVRKGILKTEEH